MPKSLSYSTDGITSHASYTSESGTMAITVGAITKESDIYIDKVKLSGIIFSQQGHFPFKRFANKRFATNTRLGEQLLNVLSGDNIVTTLENVMLLLREEKGNA